MRDFAISAGGLTLAGATTLISVRPAAAPNPNIQVRRLWAGQSANNTSAQQRVQLESQASVFPTLTAATPSKLNAADPNASVISGGTADAAGNAGINASAEGAGTKSEIFDDAFNVLNGWLFVPTPDEKIVAPAGWSQALGLWFASAPGTLTNWAFGMIFSEV